MTAERRFAYRVLPEADEVIRATVSGDVCQSTGEVVDLSLKGATVCIALEEDPTFYLSEKVTLTLNSKRMQSVQFLATVQSRTEWDGFRRFGLVFPNPSILRARLGVGLLRMFNERHSFRVEPSAQERVGVKISGKGFQRWTPSTGQLINVAKWNLLRYLPVKMRGAEDDQEETAQSFASV